MAEEKFRFLTSEEFNKLQQSEKLDYLARAVAALEERRGGWQQLFSDADDAVKSQD